MPSSSAGPDTAGPSTSPGAVDDGDERHPFLECSPGGDLEGHGLIGGERRRRVEPIELDERHPAPGQRAHPGAHGPRQPRGEPDLERGIAEGVDPEVVDRHRVRTLDDRLAERRV
jgi:hypothetical protein